MSMGISDRLNCVIWPVVLLKPEWPAKFSQPLVDSHVERKNDLIGASCVREKR